VTIIGRICVIPEPAVFRGPLAAKRKGLQLALEPLNGPGIAGYVPKP
jgi:hypothetical protein